MNIKDIEYIASLSKFKLNDDEKMVFVGQLSEVLSYIEKLNKPDTENVMPLVHPLSMTNVFRDDKQEESISRENVQFIAPAVMGAFFKVPKVIE
ncbi:MAG: Asp-tRNA(Asn)/Glu-tRNA(Gln) amidotransferase subunit GatC [Planctomycetes bacterium]|nr:Asp-tRNA(Asn)/Glu-tRNA(Gln) amidotransferase subunit GatC [Planctomycetota bacterium]MBM4064387.1 Asp-tRNA(Asn)/Glu-tRNA(Gln) amidotransferase subunit GatC [Planctomycetota bacterium]